MQRNEDGGIVISCDFCLTDWDEVIVMIEGHKGSVLCLDCLKFALKLARPAEASFDCRMCLQHFEPGEPVFRHPDTPEAAICEGCMKQAAGTFSKDPDIDWKWDRNFPCESKA